MRSRPSLLRVRGSGSFYTLYAIQYHLLPLLCYMPYLISPYLIFPHLIFPILLPYLPSPTEQCNPAPCTHVAASRQTPLPFARRCEAGARKRGGDSSRLLWKLLWCGSLRAWEIRR